MKTNIIGKSLIQNVVESQASLNNIKKNLISMSEKYDIKSACLTGKTDNIYKDNLTRGYFEVHSEYQSIMEAITSIKIGQCLMISDGKYYIGVVKESLNECNKSFKINNLYSQRTIHDPKEPIRGCDLDSIHTPKDLMKLYEGIDERIQPYIETIDLPESDMNAFYRDWIVDTWTRINSEIQKVLGMSIVVEDKSYTKYIL